MRTKILETVPATPENVAPFGMLIDVPEDDAALPVAFYEGTVRVYKPTDGDLPDLEEARAVLFDGSAGFALHIGTWHEFPFVEANDTRVVVVLRGEATNALMKDVAIDGEAHSGDLDKKDIQVRLGVELRIAA